MSERIIYDGMDLAVTMQEKLAELEKGPDEMLSSGIALANAEREYKTLLASKTIELKDRGYSVSMIDKLILGVAEIAEARYKRDIAETIYEASKERINCTKLEIRVLENQIGREYGRVNGL